MAQGSGTAAGYVIERGSVIEVGTRFGNESGTVSTNGTTLTFNFDESCDEDGISDREIRTSVYTYGISGSSLFLEEGGRVARLERVTSLCGESEFFSCEIGTCSCVTSVGSGIPTPDNDTVTDCDTL